MHVVIRWSRLSDEKRPGSRSIIRHEIMDKYGLKRESNVNGVSEYDISQETYDALQKAVKNKFLSITIK